MRNWLRNFMNGRYGPDHLGMFLLVLSVVLNLISGIFSLYILSLFSYLLLVFALYRFLSRNIERRRVENDRFIARWWPVRTKLKRRWEALKSRRQYKYFKCPACKNTLRVPRGKGRIKVTCPKCGERFEKKT